MTRASGDNLLLHALRRRGDPATETRLSADDLTPDILQSYIYGFAPVTMEATRAIFTAVPDATSNPDPHSTTDPMSGENCFIFHRSPTIVGWWEIDPTSLSISSAPRALSGAHVRRRLFHVNAY